MRSHRCYVRVSRRRLTEQPKNTPMQGIFYSPGRPCWVLAIAMWSSIITNAPLSLVARSLSVWWVRSHRCYKDATRRSLTQQPKIAPMQGIFAGHLPLTRSALLGAGSRNVVQHHYEGPPELNGLALVDAIATAMIMCHIVC